MKNTKRWLKTKEVFAAKQDEDLILDPEYFTSLGGKDDDEKSDDPKPDQEDQGKVWAVKKTAIEILVEEIKEAHKECIQDNKNEKDFFNKLHRLAVIIKDQNLIKEAEDQKEPIILAKKLMEHVQIKNLINHQVTQAVFAGELVRSLSENPDLCPKFRALRHKDGSMELLSGNVFNEPSLPGQPAQESQSLLEAVDQKSYLEEEVKHGLLESIILKIFLGDNASNFRIEDLLAVKRNLQPTVVVPANAIFGESFQPLSKGLLDTSQLIGSLQNFSLSEFLSPKERDNRKALKDLFTESCNKEEALSTVQRITNLKDEEIEKLANVFDQADTKDKYVRLLKDRRDTLVEILKEQSSQEQPKEWGEQRAKTAHLKEEKDEPEERPLLHVRSQTAPPKLTLSTGVDLEEVFKVVTVEEESDTEDVLLNFTSTPLAESIFHVNPQKLQDITPGWGADDVMKQLEKEDMEDVELRKILRHIRENSKLQKHLLILPAEEQLVKHRGLRGITFADLAADLKGVNLHLVATGEHQDNPGIKHKYHVKPAGLKDMCRLTRLNEPFAMEVLKMAGGFSPDASLSFAKSGTTSSLTMLIEDLSNLEEGEGFAVFRNREELKYLSPEESLGACPSEVPKSDEENVDRCCAEILAILLNLHDIKNNLPNAGIRSSGTSAAKIERHKPCFVDFTLNEMPLSVDSLTGKFNKEGDFVSNEYFSFKVSPELKKAAFKNLFGEDGKNMEKIIESAHKIITDRFDSISSDKDREGVRTIKEFWMERCKEFAKIVKEGPILKSDEEKKDGIATPSSSPKSQNTSGPFLKLPPGVSLT